MKRLLVHRPAMTLLPFCSKCGKETPEDAVFCPECGAPVEDRVWGSGQPRRTAYGRVNAGAAVVLSVIFPGLGQFYIGEKRRGAAFVLAGLIFLATFLIEIGLILYPIFLLINAFDTYRSAEGIKDVNGPAAAVPRENVLRSLPIKGAGPSMSGRNGKANSWAIGG
jgi:TM2 domain-containing membrane protein YozV